VLGHDRRFYQVRTPDGKTGWIERIHGEFLNPESLAFGRDGLPKKTLYLVAFNQSDLWDKGNNADKLLVDIYEHWLDPAA